MIDRHLLPILAGADAGAERAAAPQMATLAQRIDVAVPIADRIAARKTLANQQLEFGHSMAIQLRSVSPKLADPRQSCQTPFSP